ncbi:FAD-dependent oxidoreductase [Flavimobilis sp. GY10621]|uniref:FAD-dependent oxidoreductase n=1 Tax=Flavimobilis rhizosphaerae TaxID=2775421 RepID=A0ABR9DP49_9MICO|nr:FAD-dependent oxidoreductase [Flavimobilis rhizosphaerae]MBD9698897.1 FAD-dependent oxidoreductase [Flavimobilis rhizosphaerae]
MSSSSPSLLPSEPLAPEAAVLVVGAGLAGLRTAALLREHGHAGPVYLVGDEPHAPYDRPPLSKHLLDDGWHVDLGADLGIDLAALGVEVRLATRVTRIDIDGERFRAVLEGPGADTLVVDAVVLATGSRATRVPGWEHALTLHTYDDAARLRAALARHSQPRLVCIGAGWIGAEVAGVAAAAGAEVTVIEAAPHPLAGALGDVGALIAPWFRAAGVTHLTGTGVEAILPDGVVLDDGRRVDADVVLAAVGARPAPLPDGSLAELLRAQPGRGVAVDAGMRPTSAPAPTAGRMTLGNDGIAELKEGQQLLARVRVVGDAAVRASARGGVVHGGHWDGALTTPELAVRSLLDPAATLPDPAPYVFSTMLGHEVAMFGTPDASVDVVLRGDPAGEEGWAALWFAAPDPSGAASGGGSSGAASAGGASGSEASGAKSAEASSDTIPNLDLRTLTGIFVVDRPRDVAAARRLFCTATLPRLDPTRAGNPALPLR